MEAVVASEASPTDWAAKVEISTAIWEARKLGFSSSESSMNSCLVMAAGHSTIFSSSALATPLAVLAVDFLTRFGAGPALVGEVVEVVVPSMYLLSLRSAPRYRVAAEDALMPAHLAISS